MEKPPPEKSLLSNKTFLFAFAVIVAAVVIFHRLGEAYLAGDDAYYSQVAKEMARSGDYLTPHHGGDIDFHTSKPPMLFWLNAAAGKIFGFTSGAMRLPSAFLGFLGVAALLIFVERYFDFFTAAAAAVILTFTQQYLYHSRSAVTDGPFAVFFAFSLMAFWVARAEKNPLFFYLMGLSAGLAVMTRQVPGFFIYCAAAAYIVLAREYDILKNPHFYGGALVAAAVFLPWHIAMYLKHGDAFVRQYFGVTMMTAIKGYPADYSSSPSLNPWYAYAKILLENYWPWLPFLAAGVYQSVKNYAAFEPARRKNILFILLWAFVPLALFQAAKVKQYHYIVPLYVPFAVISATVIAGFKEKMKRKAAAAIFIVAAWLAVSYLIFPIIPKTLDSREFNDTMLMISDVKSARGDIFAVRKGFSHYQNCFLFYGDKKITLAGDGEFVRLVNSGAPGTFVIFKEKYDELKSALATGKIFVIKETKDSILFANSKR